MLDLDRDDRSLIGPKIVKRGWADLRRNEIWLRISVSYTTTNSMRRTSISHFAPEVKIINEHIDCNTQSEYSYLKPVTEALSEVCLTIYITGETNNEEAVRRHLKL